MIVTVASKDGIVNQDDQPEILVKGNPCELPTQPYKLEDAGLFQIKASFRNLEYENVNEKSLLVRLVDSVTHEDHFIEVPKAFIHRSGE